MVANQLSTSLDYIDDTQLHLQYLWPSIKNTMEMRNELVNNTVGLVTALEQKFKMKLDILEVVLAFLLFFVFACKKHLASRECFDVVKASHCGMLVLFPPIRMHPPISD